MHSCVMGLQLNLFRRFHCLVVVRVHAQENQGKARYKPPMCEGVLYIFYSRRHHLKVEGAN